MVVLVAFSYKAKRGTRFTGISRSRDSGRHYAWIARKTKAQDPVTKRWQRVLYSKFWDLGVLGEGAYTRIYWYEQAPQETKTRKSKNKSKEPDA